jgi:biopolymer transport protein TolQ
LSTFATPLALLLQINVVEMFERTDVLEKAVLGILICFSLFSWTVIFAKWSALRNARQTNRRFLRAFRKANGLEAVVVASEQFRPSPLVSVFDFGYEEVERQVKSRGRVASRTAVERALQLGVSEELTKLERNMPWLATTASVTPFIGLFGTVWGVMDAFAGLGDAGTASLRAVAPGIAEALITTAAGLFAAIPALIAYNHYLHGIRGVASRMNDFASEFVAKVETLYSA